MAEFPQCWQQALDRVARARSSPIHMPAALLVALDMVEAGEATEGSIDFAAYEKRFRTLIAQVRPGAASSAWVPFYHLSAKSDVWDLCLGDGKADFSDLVRSPKSRSRLVKRADRAQFKDDLRGAVVHRSIRTEIRDSIYGLLRADGLDVTAQLVEAHRHHRRTEANVD